MSANLSPQLSAEYECAENLENFFTTGEQRNIRIFERREQTSVGKPSDSCNTNLFFGFFFDGTKNNYIKANATNNHSNVARLYDCFPGKSVPGILPEDTDWKHNPSRYAHFFKIYVPGVSSPFVQVGDTGEGWDEITGGAGGRMGEHRIIWALVQAINNVHRYFFSAPLISQEETDSLLKRAILNKRTRAAMLNRPSQNSADSEEKERPCDSVTRICFENVLRKLHVAVSQHWLDKRTGKPAKINPAIVKTIYVSVFGFSRGATQARAFTNWFLSLCELDAQLCGKAGRRTLGGFEVQFDFLGIFDTVASVGLGNTLGGFKGHGAWADSEDSLRIPSGIRCLHLVAAHELRRSFPVDSISVHGSLASGCQEIVVPGVHSDIGCGYCPMEQGRGTDPNGDDMLARIPLLLMYKAARMNGVPLKLELANPPARLRFKLRKEAIEAFNAYIANCEHKHGPIHHIMREQARKQMEWRVYRRISGKNAIQQSASFLRASNFDKNDMYSAAREFEDEIAEFLAWKSGKGSRFIPSIQRAGFSNDHEAEWEEIATWWGKVSVPDRAVIDFFDNYVHDSRAWFKLFPGNPDSEDKAHAQLKGWVARRELGQANISSPVLVGKTDYRTVSDRLSPAQRVAADEYKKTARIPRMITEGREPWKSRIGWLAGAGYLRFRKIYGGVDTVLLSSLSSTASGPTSSMDGSDKGKAALA
ncbi:DUF2235 domain-containing protein [Massilia sp. UMI-21]|nr:DUF2235 domain-containing protein [Massilia sp. UMI-21]